MVTAGIREMKAHLSGYMERVKNGELVSVTDRGHQIAIVLPVHHFKHSSRVFHLLGKGVILAGERKPLGLPRPIKIKGKPLSNTILEERIF